MKLVIKPEANPPKYVNTYVLRIKFMSGDADAYEDKEFALNHDDAVRCLTFLTALAATYDHGGRDGEHRLGGEAWKSLPHADVVDGYYRWNDPAKGDWRPLIEWPNDATCDVNASLDEFSLAWFDATGAEHEVEVQP